MKICYRLTDFVIYLPLNERNRQKVIFGITRRGKIQSISNCKFQVKYFVLMAQ